MATLTSFVRTFVPSDQEHLHVPPPTAAGKDDNTGRLIRVANVGMRQGLTVRGSPEASVSTAERVQAQFKQETRDRDTRGQKSYMEIDAARTGRRPNTEARAAVAGGAHANNTDKILRSLERPEPVRFHHHQDVRLTEATSGPRNLSAATVRSVATLALPKQPQHAPAMRAEGRFGF